MGKEVAKLGKNIGDSALSVGSFLDPLSLGPRKYEQQQKEIEKARQIKSETSSDIKNFEKFKAQESNLLQNPGQELFVPKYKRAAGLKKQTEALANIFNSRKQEVLSRSAMPGISQTRF